ncbi:hypothetical protein DTO271G3_6710 [Paecilomyces variotii]|nr:hypothetical protein DTO271G3_6710 [Paecilomyces variotii]
MATVHEARATDPRLSDHAATAALYVTHTERKVSIRSRRQSEVETLGAMDPSISPPGGLTLASASAAASLAHANRRPLEIWRPGKLPAAEKAAYHARDYRIETPEPQPRADRLSVEGLKNAAVLAARESRALTSSTPPPPNQKYQYLAEERVIMSGGRVREDKVIPSQEKGALLAATGALRNTRRRAESAPPEPAVHPEAGYALSAATISHLAPRPSEDYLEELEEPIQASRIHNIAKTNAQLYTSHPPVDVETEEQNRKDTLRAAAISMAQEMYSRAQKGAQEDEGATLEAVQGAQRGHSRLGKRASLPGTDESATARAVNLQLAAQKLASEKLARMQSQNEYEIYYGTAQPPRARRSVTGRLRRRTSSETDTSRLDMERSIRIRNQMSTLQTQLHEVDEKRRRDREDLMEIAMRNARAAIQDIDDRVYAETGKPSPAMQREWEEKAQERAKRSLEAESRLDMRGKVEIGDRQYVDAVDVEAVAMSRIRPTLDEIDQRAEERKAREIERRLDEEERKRLEAIEREREADLKAAMKAQKAASKKETKERKAAAAEQEMLDKDDEWKIFRRLSKRAKGKEPAAANEGPISGAQDAQQAQEAQQAQQAQQAQEAQEAQEAVAEQRAPEDESGTATGAAEQVSPTSTSPKGESRLKHWFRSTFGARNSKQTAESQETSKPEEENASSFVGGAALTGATRDDARGAALSSHPVTEEEQPNANGYHNDQDASEGEVGQSGGALRQWSTSTGPSEKDMRQSNGHSTRNGESRRSRLKTNLKDMMRRPESRNGSALSPPQSPTTPGFESTAADASRPDPVRVDTAERNELQDAFREETLPAPPPLRTVAGRTSSSSNRDSRFLEDL